MLGLCSSIATNKFSERQSKPSVYEMIIQSILQFGGQIEIFEQ